MSIYVFRHDRASSAEFGPHVEKIMGKSTYQRVAKTENAPTKIDCLTLIYYLFKQALGHQIPITYIGNMARQFDKLKEWTPINVDETSLIPGDVILVRKIGNQILISHAGIYIGNSLVLHITKKLKIATADTVQGFFKNYEQELPLDQAIKYIDHRDKEQRASARGRFTETSEPQIWVHGEKVPTPLSQAPPEYKTPFRLSPVNESQAPASPPSRNLSQQNSRDSTQGDGPIPMEVEPSEEVMV